MSTFRITAAIMVLGGTVLAISTPYAIPRYSARYEQDCNLCHINPTGAGARATYATRYIVPQEMSIIRLDEEQMAALSPPEFSENVILGTDLRTMFFSSRDDPTNPQDFFQMQGNLYLSFQMSDRLLAHMSRGLSSTYEVFGLGYFLPANGYIKVGRFTPDFGWRISDHTAFVREFTGFVPPSHTDVGVEAGIYPGRFAITSSLQNGNPGSTQESFADNDLQVAGRASYRGNVGGLAFVLGGSALRNRTILGDRTVAGPLGYLSWKGLTWLWEADFAEMDSAGAGTAKSWYASNELSYQAVRGLDLITTFDYWDPNRSADTGTRIRYGLGVESMPYPFVMVNAAVNLYRNKEGDLGMAVTDPEYDEVVLQVHFFY
jgi:hypothetical protein